MWTMHPGSNSLPRTKQQRWNIGGILLTIYLRFNRGNLSSITTVKPWLIKACLFWNQSIKLDGPLHLVAIISFSFPKAEFSSYVRKCVVLHVCADVLHTLLHGLTCNTGTNYVKYKSHFWLFSFAWDFKFKYLNMFHPEKTNLLIFALI